MGKRLRITTSSFSRLEKNDLVGNIKLSSLAKAANAMDCELIYFFRLKSHRSYADEIWNILLPKASQNGMFRAARGDRKQRALYGSVKREMARPAVARAQGWSARRLKMFYERYSRW